ncbi:sigma 54-interacting transcriptional regulator [bacterium]|nr:sigma 54-interacting transcriptional regulator [bacterium]
MVKENIIFICNNNSSLSQIAEGFARKIAPERVVVHSAGTAPAKQVHPFAIEIMKEFEIDISNQSPKSISSYKKQLFNLAVTLCDTARKEYSFLPGSPAVVHWDLNDPAEGKGTEEEIKQRFRDFAQKIQILISNLFNFGYYETIASQQQNFISLLNKISNATIAHDLNRKIFFVSEQAAELIGTTPLEIIGKDCHDVFEPRLCGANCSFCDGDEIPSYEKKTYSMVYHTPNGNRKELDGTVIPLKNTDGSYQGVVLSLADKTKLVTLERQLNKQKSFRGIVGCDHQMMQIFQQIRDVALYDYPVHIHGETGVGKELVAKAIHEESIRGVHPFVPINCGALPEGLVESELFGHEKGAFTGAVRDKKGRIEMARGGTVFLDEVADLPKSVQVKLLRFLQEGTVEKVGSEKLVNVNARVISATNKDLKQEVKKDNFREDLFYRLCVIPFFIPPLRKRKNDIVLLCEYFLGKIHELYKDRTYTISGPAMSMLMDYNWPGNVRELENIIRFATVKCKDNIITPSDLPIEFQVSQSQIPQRGATKKLDTETVKSSLIETGGNKAKAARLLGVGRATLYRFLNENPGLSN